MARRDSSRSRSPVARRRTSRVEFESPHGHGRKEHKLDLPTSFQSDRKYIDKNSCFGRQFYRNVCSTPWSQQVGLANRPVDSVKVHELCYLGWENHNLRALSAGAFVSVVFGRSVREAQLAEVVSHRTLGHRECRVQPVVPKVRRQSNRQGQQEQSSSGVGYGSVECSTKVSCLAVFVV